MPALTVIVDDVTGEATVEGLDPREAGALFAGVFANPLAVNCALPPRDTEVDLGASGGVGAVGGARPAPEQRAAVKEAIGRVARLYHSSVVDGPGRRSVVALQGCPIRCPGCHVPETHDQAAGTRMASGAVLDLLSAATGAPRDGVTILGGEPFAQLDMLSALVAGAKEREAHVAVYSGYALPALVRRDDPRVNAVLRQIDLLVDGPYLRDHTHGVAPYRGSANQFMRERAELDDALAGRPVRHADLARRDDDPTRRTLIVNRRPCGQRQRGGG